MLLVAALGGNALLTRGQPLTAEAQRRAAAAAARALAPAAASHRLVVTHGNGPQVGLLALQEEAYADVPAYPLDVLGAETEGMIGYVLEQELDNVVEGDIATLLTRMVVDADDPAFTQPTKPIGPVYEETEAKRLAAERGWTVAPDGDRWRRVVPSPEPRRVIQLPVLRMLIDAGVITVCAGGGGIPVIEHPDGTLQGVEAVIDKDLASSLLATQLAADALVLLTDVEAVVHEWGTPFARPIRAASPATLRGMDFAAGSMGPKVEAVCRFVEATGGWAAIGRLDQVAAIVGGQAGTWVTRDVTRLELGEPLSPRALAR